MSEPKDTPKAAPEGSESAPAADKKKVGRRPKVAIGIGSAAIVAALLYANRSKRSDRGE